MSQFDISQDGEPFELLNSILLNTSSDGEFGALDIIDDDAAVQLLLHQFKFDPVIKGHLASFNYDKKNILFQISEIKRLKLLDQAVGWWLDVLGALFLEPRQGRGNDEYRSAILFKIFIEESYGEIETLISYIRYRTGNDIAYYRPRFPAKQLFEIVGPNIPDASLIDELNQISAGGVKTEISYDQGDEIFGFDGEGGLPPFPGIEGFGETGIGYENDGGKFCELITQ